MNSLENVKVGDKLLVNDRHGGSIQRVERITATLIITKDYRFKKKSGDAIGCSSWTYISASPASDDDVRRVNLKNLRIKLIAECEAINFKRLTLTQLNKILEIANEEV